MKLHFLGRAAERAKGTLSRFNAVFSRTGAGTPFTVKSQQRLAVVQTIFLSCALLFSAGAALLTTDVDAASVCAAPGRDTIPTSGVVNSYWGGASATNGGTNATITLGTQRTGSTNTPFGTSAIPSTGISAGDLLIVMQMQGAGAGAYEYVTVVSPTGPVTSGSITVRGTGSNGGLLHTYTQSYSSGNTFQVIRVPQVLNASMGNYSSATWDIDANGYGTGGVFALDVAQQASLNGTVDVSGQGFRGGAGFNIAGHGASTLTSSSLSYPSTSNTGGSKGEGTGGTPGYVFDGYSATIKQYNTTGLESAAYSLTATPTAADGNYSAGSFGFGAIGNAGGGGNDALPGTGTNQYNSGGAGGGSAGRGGQGGWTWVGTAGYCSTTFNPASCPFVTTGTATGEGITDAGGRGGLAVGGLSAGMVVLGGGGGAASENNNAGTNTVTTYPPIDVAVDPTTLSGGSTTVDNGATGPITGSGARGGGIVLLRAGTFNAGAGAVNANGIRAYNQFGTAASEAAAGGGGGGAIVILAQAASGTLNASAVGGRGGDSDYFSHGPGGGGGGGFILTNFSVSGTVDKGGSGYTPNIGNPPANYTFPNHYGSDAVDGVAGYLSSAGGTTPGTSSGAACEPDVAATVTLPATGAVGANISGSFNYINNGPSDAQGVGVTASLTAGLGTVSFGTPTLNGVALSGVTETYNNSTGVITVTGLPTTLPNAQTLALPFSFTMPANGTSVTGTDSVTESGLDPVPSNNNGTATVNGTAIDDDAVTITGLPASAAPSAAIFGVLNYVNNGPSPSLATTYSAKLPVGAAVSSIKYNGTTLAGASATVGADGTVTFTGLPATLNSSDTVTVAFNATMPANGSSVAATANISSSTTDSNTSNNSAAVIVTGSGSADLATSITGLPTSAQAAGTAISGSVKFQNNGPNSAQTPTYTVQVPPGSTISASQVLYNGTPINGVTVTIDQYGNVTFGGTGLPSTLNSGDTVTIGFSSTMPSDGSNANAVSSISSPTADPNLNNNNATATTPGISEADLQSTVTGYATFAQTAGTVENGTISFANNGPSSGTGVSYTTTTATGLTGVTLGTPTLNGVAIAGATASYNTTTGAITYTGLPTTLASGDKITVTMQFTMPGTPVTVSTNIQGNTADPVPSNNSASVTIAGGNDLSVALTNFATTSQATGATENGTITFSNLRGTSTTATSYTPVLNLTAGLGAITLTASGTATNAAAATATYNTATGAVTFANLPVLAAGQTLIFTLGNFVMPANNVVVTSSISESPNIDTYSPNNSATTTIQNKTAAQADMATTITGLGGVAAAGSTVSSGVIQFTNLTAATAATATSFAATLPVGATVTAITLNGTAIPGASATVAANGTVTFSGMPTTVAGNGVVAVSFSFPMPANGSAATATATVTSSNDSVTTNNTATATETGDAATDLQTIITEPASAAPSATITGQVRYVNNGPNSAVNPTYQLTLPVAGGTPAITSVMLNGSLLSVTTSIAANGVVTFSGLPTTLNSGDVLMVNFTAKMPANGNAISTTGQITYPGTDTVPANNAATATTTGNPNAPTVMVTKTVDHTTHNMGDQVTWTLTVNNTGTSATTGIITLTDQLPNNISNVVVTPNGATCSPNSPTAGTTLTCSVPAGLAAGNGTATVTISATLLAAGTYNNSVVPEGNSTDNPTCMANACSTVTVVGSATVQILKDSIDGTGSFGYVLTNLSATSDNITTQNQNTSTAGVINVVTSLTTAVTVNENSVPTGFALTSASCVDTNAAADGNVTTAFGSLSGTTLTIPAADIKQNAVIQCTFVNTATESIKIAKTGPTAMVTGTAYNYVLTVSNTSATATVTTAQVKDQLPANFTFNSATGLNWTCSAVGQLITCSFGGASIGPGGNSTITISATPTATAANVINYATVDGTGGTNAAAPAGCNASNTCALSPPATVTAAGGLTIAKSAPTPSLAPGANSTYTLTVTNNGTTAATSATVKDQLPTSALSFVSAVGTPPASWTCGNASGLITCTFAGSIAAGGTSSVAITVKPTSNAVVGTSVTNYASIDPTGGTAPPTPGASCTPSTSCASNTSTVGGPNVQVTKTVDQANHSVGDTITWTLRAANTGAAATTGAVTLTDTLPSNIGTPINVTPSAGTTCSTTTPAAGATFTCTVPAGLAATTGVATATITAIANATGTVSNTVVPSGTDNPTCASGACTASTQVAGQSLTLSKALTGNRIASGDQFTVEIMAGASTVSSATTTGSGNTVSNGTTGETPVTAGTTYTLTEVAAGTTSLAQYTSGLACTNAATGSATTLPTTVGGTVTPAAGDRITCTITNSAKPVLNLTKALGTARVHNTDQFTLQIANGATVVATATTTGTGSALGSNSTGGTTLSAGTTYTLSEIASGGTQLAQYTSALACTNSTTGSATVLPTSLPGNVTPANGDNITCTLTNSAKPPVVTYLATLTGTRAANTDQFTLAIANGATTVDSVTTTGTGGTITNNTTGPQTLVSGDTYSLTEAAAGTTNLAQYTSALSCTNADASSATTLPTTLPAALVPMVGDNITCTVAIAPITPTVTLTKALGSNREAANDQFTLQINNGATTVASTTTTGTGNTVATGSVGPTALTSGTTYTLTEVASGGANLALYTKTLACTNSLAGSTTVLPTTVPGTITPQDGDAISCTLTNTGIAELATTKTLLTVNGAAPTATVKPGDVLVYQLAIQNSGETAGTTTLGETVPLNTTYTGAGAEGWGGTCAAAGSTCSQSVSVAAVTTVNKTFTVTVAGSTSGASISNTASSSNGTCTTCTVTTPIAAELTATKTLLTVNGAAPGASVKPGDVLVYQLAIQNNGGTSGTTTLGETVPTSTAYSGAAGEGWGGTCAAAGSTCSQAVTVAAAATVNKTFTVTVAAGATGASIVNTASSSVGTCTATCSVTTPLAAELVATKTLLTVNGAAPTATVKPGDVLVYQLAVKNNGGTSGTTTLGETVPTNTAYSGAAGEGWGGTCAAAGSTCSQAVTVAAAATVNKTFTVTVAAGATGASIVNTASSSVGTCTATCSVTTPIAAELVTTKTLLTVNGAAPGASVKAGDVLVYQLAVVNNGGTSGTTTLGETVPAGTAYSGAGTEGWGGTCAAAASTCTQAATVAAATTVNKTFTVTVAASATGASVVNTATTSVGSCTAGCSVTTPLAAGVLATTKTLLTVNGAAPTATVKPGDVLVYQLALQNTGGSAATTSLGETVPTGTTYSGAGAEGWGGTCAAAGTTCSQSVSVNAGVTIDKTFTVTVAAGATGSSIVNTATSSVGSCTACSVTTPIAAELVATKTLLTVNGAAPTATVKPGDVLVYQLAVKNNGGTSGTTTLGETVPTNTAYSGAAGEGWGGTCAAAGSTCSQAVTVAAAATVNKTFTVTVAAGATGASIVNTASSSVGTCTATCSVTTPIAAELVATKTLLTVNGAAPTATVKPGDVLVYQLAVQNTGGASGTTTLGESVPANTAYSGAAGEGWGGTCAAAGSTCSQAVTVAGASTVNKTFTVTVAAGASGTSIINVATSSVGTCSATCSVTTPLGGILATSKTLLSVNGAAPGGSLKAGDVLVYQIAVQNTGGSAATTTLGETVPVNTAYSGAGAEGWGGTCAAAGTTCSQAVTAAAGATVDKTFTVTVSAAVAGASIVNSVTSSNGSCGAACTVTTPVAAPTIATTKTLLTVNGAAPGASVKPGDVLVYQLAIQNSGGSSGTTTLGETVPTGTTYSGAGAEGWGGTCAAAGSTCSQAVTVTAANTVNKTFTVTVAAGATGASIVNTATSSVGTCTSCSVTTPIAAELTTTKTLLTVNGAAPGASVKPGDVLVYQLAIQNTGGVSGTTTVGETVPVNTTYTGAGAEGWGGTCAAAGSTCSQAVTLAAATSVNKTFTVTVAAGASGASITNTATTSAGTCTATCSVSTPIAAELVTTKTLLTVNGAAPGASVKPGDVLVYQLAVTNNGGSSGTTTLGETVPTGATYSGAGAEGWGGTCAAAATTCSQAVTVAAAATVNKTFTVTVAAGATGASIVNTASSSVGTCTATCSVSTPIAAELVTTKTLLTVNGAAPGATVKPGDVLVYQLAIQNNGGSSGTTTLGETVPVKTAYSGAAGEGWGGACAAAGTSCSQAVTVAAAATVTKTFTVTVAAGASGASIVNTASSSVGTCTATCSVTTPIAAELTTTKTLLSVNGAAPAGTVKPGDVLVYQLAVQNAGGASGTTTLGETVPGNTAYSGAAGEGWGGTCAAAGSTCSQAVTVTATSTVNKTFTVTVAAGATGASIVNTASSSVGTCSAACSVTTPIAAELATSKTLLTVNGAAPAGPVKPGDVLVYQLAIQNSGGSTGTTTLGETVPVGTTYSGAGGEGWGGACAAAGSTCSQAVTVAAATTLDKTFTVTVAAGVSGASISNSATSSAGSCTTCTVTTPTAAEIVTTKTLLTVNGAAPGATVKPGDVLVYQIAVQNTGGAAGTTTLGETVPVNTTYSGAGAEGWGGTCLAAGSTCAQAVPVPATSTVNKSFTVTVAAGATGSSIVNTASSSVGTCSAACSVTTPLAAQLATTKTLLTVNGAAPGGSVKPGDVLVYQLAVKNNGGASGTTTLGETVPTGTTYSGAAGEGWGGTCAAAGSTCSQSVTATAGATVAKTFTVTVAAGASGASIVNTATSSTGTCTSCSVTTSIGAELTTTKTLLTVNGAAPTASVKPGDVLVYQLAVQNNGGASGSTTLGETVPVNTAYSGAAGEGWGGTCAAAGSTCAQAVTVAAASTVNKTFTVTVAAAASGASIVNTATSSTGSCSATCSVTTPIVAEISTTKTLLTVNGAAPGASVKAGDVLVYQLAVHNAGGSTGSTALGETVPTGTTYSGAAGEGWGGTCAAAGSTCAQTVPVPAVTTINKTFTVTVAASVTGASIVNNATSSTGTCTTCSVTTPVAAGTLATTKTLLSVNGAAPGASVKEGDVLVYQIAVSNSGGSAATTSLGETVPANTAYSGAAGEGWGGTCAAAGSNCAQSVTVNAGATVNHTFTVTVAAGIAAASISNTVTSSVGTCGANCTVTTPVAAGVLNAVKTLLTVNGAAAATGATVKGGDVLVYQIAVTNSGGSGATTSLGETVPSGTTYTGAAEGWSAGCAAAGSTCTQSVSLSGGGAPVNKTFTVTVSSPTGATTTISNVVTSSVGTCSACTVNDPVAQADVLPTLTFPNSALPNAAVSGTIVYSNSGPSTAFGLTYTASLTPGLGTPTFALPAGVTANYNNTTGVVTFTGLPTSLASGANAGTITVNFTQPASGTTTVVKAGVTTTTNDPVPGNNNATADVTGTAQADLTSTLNVPNTVNAGSTVTGTVAYGNLGPSPALTPNYILTLSPGLGTVTFSNLPAGVSAAYDPGTGNVTFTNLPSPLNSGANVPAITFSYVQPSSGMSSVTSNISSPTTDPVLGNNAHTDPVGGVPEADTSAKLTFPANVNAGATVSGTLVYANVGPSPAANVTYSLTLASGLTNVTFPNLPAGLTATYNQTTGVVTLGGLPANLPSGTTEPTINISYLQPAGGSSAVSATIASSTADPDLNNNNPTVNIGGNPEADSSVTLNFPTNVAGFQPVSGTVTFSNAGPSIANGETYTLMLTPGLAGVSFANLPTGVAASYASGTGVVTLTGMPASLGVNASVGPITVNYTQPASGVSRVTATVASSTQDPNTGNNSAQANVVGTAATADLAIQISAPATVAPDGSLIYTLTITNNGPGAADNATFTDTLPSVLGVPTASCAPASGGVTCGTTSVSGKTVSGTLTSLPSGGTAVVTITTTAPASGTFTNTATVAAPSGIVDPVPANNTSSTTTSVGAVPNNVDLSVTASGTTSVQPSGTVTYVVDVVNGGPSAANNAVFAYSTATPVTNVTWTCVAVGGGAVCPAASGTGNNINQTIATFPDGGHLEYTITGKAPAAAQQFVDTATITAPAGVTETNTANNTATTTTNVQNGAAPSADLATTINGPSTVQPGAPVVYTVVVTDNGPAAANGATLTVPVASQVTGVTTTCVASGGAVCPTVAPGNNISTVIPTLPNGGQLTFTVTGTAPQSGTFDTSATVTTPTGINDPVPSNNTAGPVVTSVPNLTADLSIQKNGPAQVVANGIVNYTITVSNAGPNAADGATITDNLPAGLSNVTAVCSNPSGGATCGPATVTGTVMNASAATLPAAGSITVTVSGRAPASGSLSNSASVKAPAGVTDPNPGNNTAGPVVTAIVASVPTQADLSATLSGPSTVAPNGLVTYQLTITNAGPAAGDGAPVTDVLPAVLTNAHATCGNALGGAACGAVTVNGNTIASSIAALPVGASLTFTITANAPASGTFTNSASVGAAPGTTDPNTANNIGGPVVTTIGAVSSIANLGISKTGPTMAGAGADFSYTIIVSNAGPGAANGAVVADPVPTGLTNIRASCANPTNGAVCGPVVVTGQNVSSAVTTLPALGTVTLTITVTAPVPSGLQQMSVVNRATVTPPPGVNDPDSSDNISGAVETSIVAAGVSGTVWLDLNHDRKDDSGDPALPNWIVELFHNGVLVATTTTNAQGQYSFTGVPPGPGYSIDFRDPGSKAIYGTPTNGDQGTPNPDSDAVIGNGIIESLTLKPGINIVQQSLPVDPSGVVYDATSRTPIGGATVTLVGPAGFNPATQLVGGAANVSQVTGGVGLTAGDYQFLLINPGGAGGAPAGTYTIVVTPPSGYLPTPAKGGGVEAPAGTFIVPGPLSATTAIQPNARPPKVGDNGPGTVYYFNLVFNAGSGSLINNHIPLDRISGGALTVTKTGNTTTADIGETVLYTVDVTSTVATLPNVTVTDRLPRGFTYITGTTTINGVRAADPKGAFDGDLTFTVGTVATGVTSEIKYRVRVGVGAQQGDGVNRAQAQNPLGATSNVATFKVDVNGGVFTTDACVVGKVFVDCNGNQIQDAEELGIPGVRLYFSDGTFVVTDAEGKYSYCGLRPTTHTLKVDRSTMPLGSVLVESSNRNALDPNSLFIDLKNGEMHQADFIEGSCSAGVMEQVKARRGQGEVNAAKTTQKVAPALIFDSKPIASPPGAAVSPAQGVTR
jgi:uncharacterized repeat protein (TIGR01451 family)